MTAIIIGAFVIAYLAFHVGAGHTHHRYRRAHGPSPNSYWSPARGPYAGIRLPGGSRAGHRL
ncbi:MAG: hypothetical protein ACRDRJ_20265 [Streptosporangiaceae bacterium]